MQTQLSIQSVFQTEPALRDIVETAVQLVALGNNKWVMYSKAKAQAQPLVGWTARNGALRSTAAYDLFIDHLCDRLGL